SIPVLLRPKPGQVSAQITFLLSMAFLIASSSFFWGFNDVVRTSYLCPVSASMVSPAAIFGPWTALYCARVYCPSVSGLRYMPTPISRASSHGDPAEYEYASPLPSAALALLMSTSIGAFALGKVTKYIPSAFLVILMS